MTVEEARKYTEFNVNGAGTLRISDHNKSRCGGEYGFSLQVSWGKNGFIGGNIPNNEAKKLARHILSVIEAEDTEAITLNAPEYPQKLSNANDYKEA